MNEKFGRESYSVDRSQLVDMADSGAWPQSVFTLLQKVGSTFPRRPKPFATDLDYGSDFGESLEITLRRLLAGQSIALYHATRLLPEEVESIRKEGLLTGPKNRAVPLP